MHPAGGRPSRGGHRRNEELRRLREAVPGDAAVLGIDLSQAERVVVVTGPGHRVLARRASRCSPRGVDRTIDLAPEVASRHGLGRLVVACEPTGHRWEPVLERCSRRGIALACVQPLLVAREREDRTEDRTDPKDATLIAHLAVTTDPDEVAAMGSGAFARAVAEALPRVGGERRRPRIVRAFRARATDPRKIPREQPGAAERAAFALADLLHAASQVAAGALLRQPWAVSVHRRAWDPAIAGGAPGEVVPAAERRHGGPGWGSPDDPRVGPEPEPGRPTRPPNAKPG